MVTRPGTSRSWSRAAVLAALLLGAACAAPPDEPTLGSLAKRKVTLPPERPVKVDKGKVVEGYRRLLKEAPEDEHYREAMRRLADLELELGQDRAADGPAPGAGQLDTAIRLYENFLANYPGRKGNDNVLYQLAKAYDLRGERARALHYLDRLVNEYPDTRRRTEVQFRRGELLFVMKRYPAAAEAYTDVLRAGPDTPFYEKAQYKLGWSLFKQGRYEEAVAAFMKLLDWQLARGKLRFDGPALNLSRTEKELLEDVLRVISLSFSYLEGPRSVDAFFSASGPRPYEAIVYDSLGRLYLRKERIRDAAEAFLAFARRYPTDERAPQFHQRAIAAYEKGAFASLILPAKEDFVRRFGVGSAYWRNHKPEVRDRLRPLLATHLRDLATHYHAAARKSRKPADFAVAAQWYQAFLAALPDDPQAAAMNYLLAECLWDGGRLAEAVAQYEKTAYGYPPHRRSAEAAYTAMLGYRKLAQRAAPGERAAWQARAMDVALRFAGRFPEDKRVPAVLARTAQDLLDAGDHERALATAQQLLRHPAARRSRKYQRIGWTVGGHAHFEQGRFAAAEDAYGRALKLYSRKDKAYAALRERLAASIYKQAEAQRDAGDLAAAVEHFLRVGRVAAGSAVAATAQYDAAAALIQLQDWKRAARVLEDFRRRWPRHELQAGVTEKLALVYTRQGDSSRAAREIERLARGHADPKVRQAMLWQAANMYREAGRRADAIRAYTAYVKQFPDQMPESQEARFQLANLHRRAGHARQRFHWLREIVRADRRHPDARTPRTRDIAASALLQLAEPAQAAYRRVRLSYPIKKNLKKKKRLMQQAIEAYRQAMAYNVAEVTTAATFRLAELYNDFARALMASERPRNLPPDAMEQYEILLEEQAFPFEEKAIEIHAANVKRITEGVYDKWVKKSLAELAKLQPVRYAKQEQSEELYSAIH